MKHLEDTKKAIVFTDVKDFTLKNSLLTQLQVRKFLNTQDWLVIPSIKKFRWKVIKTIWDSFLIVFDSIECAINASIEIQKRLRHYNSKVNFNLNKIELRIIINYWDVQKEKTLIWEDYFWDVINIASRLQNQVIENRIYATSNVINELKWNEEIKFKYLWETSLRWILYKVWVYEILYDEELITSKDENLENNHNILVTKELKIKKNEVSNTIIEFSLITAIAWIQNIPHIWAFIMFPFHMFLLKKIANKFQVIFTKKEIKEIILTMFFSLTWILLIVLFENYIETTKFCQYTWYFVVILNFLLSFFIWKILSNYFYIRSQKVENANRELKNMLKEPNKK
jgi:class 3 adenylate cyclase